MNKTTLYKIIKFIMFIIIISFVLDKLIYFTLNKISDQVYSGQAIGKLNQYLKIKDSTNLIVYGSSRANHHFDVNLLSNSSYNIGMDGKFIAYSAVLIKLLPKNKKQNIILHLDPGNAFKNTYNMEEIKPLMVKYRRNKIIKNEIDKAGITNPLQMFYWCYDYNGLTLAIIKNAMLPKYDYKNYNGFDPLEVSETQKNMFINTLNTKDTIYCNDNSLVINKIFKQHLLEIQTFCRQNNKTLTIITSPFYNDTCKEDNKKFNSILQEMNIAYFDYSDFFKEHNAFDLWKDKMHLSKLGAEKFSEQLSLEILFNE